MRLDEAILPVRDLREAVTSRIALELGSPCARPGTASLDAPWREFGTVPGGVTDALEPLDQVRILGHAFHPWWSGCRGRSGSAAGPGRRARTPCTRRLSGCAGR
ncbi:MAG: hypothetical protein PGN25_01000 [Methylorubrum populi]